METEKLRISILGCGWLGLPLAKHLCHKGFLIKGSTTTPAKMKQLQQLGIQPYLIKATPQIEVNSVQDFFETDILILNIPPKRRQPNIATYYPQQVEAVTSYILKHQIPNVLFLSSTSVYPNLNKMVTEEEDGEPTKVSGQAVKAAESILQRLPRTKTTILRLAGLVGEGRNPGQFLAGRQNLANGNAPINLVHQADCIAIITAIIEENHWGTIFNVCAEGHPSRKEFLYSTSYSSKLTSPSFFRR